ncbi:MAG: M14 family metallopeptidase [Ferruginibacter sp.]|nr:M14 family metallopeptidase [Bacteroidota bacterium]MBX2920391.1 M14 family metallopeptidase [Ferruginibacter sp.]
MRKTILLLAIFFTYYNAGAQQCRFEKTDGLETATYFEAINWYKNLDKVSSKVLVKEMGMTDAGYPLHLVMVSDDGKFDPLQWHKQNKAVILINNGIHPGEPDGIDASMMLVRDIVKNKIKLPGNVALAFIPVYNIGGCLNRNSYSRANQNGPKEYGFRGNAQNLDLNRDFTKSDSKNAKSFAQIYHFVDPDILIDNHVSDGADYQHTMTILTTQYNKLGAELGGWLKNKFEPQLYKSMADKGWDMVPYVSFETAGPEKGMVMFYDSPRYSSGYTTLFQTIGFMPETHMLKPYKQRVLSTYSFSETMIEKASLNAKELIAERKKARQQVSAQKSFALKWNVDTSKYSYVTFKGYEQAYKPSDATGLSRMYYDRTKPFTKQVRFFDTFKPNDIIEAPKAYIIPQGWWTVIDLLKLNGVQMQRFTKDTIIDVQAYHIDDYKSYPKPYEKHHKNMAVKTSVMNQQVRFLKGDYIIWLNQPANRYLVEMLEPTGDDSFFSWNFFDAVLQQKEGYSDYRWDDLAAEVLKNNPGLKAKLEEKKKTDEKFAANESAQLNFIYINSPYYEPSHNRYPVYRLNY